MVDERLQVLQSILALLLENGMNIVRVRRGGHIPFTDVADAFRMLEERSRHQRDVAKRGAGREQNDTGVAGILVQPCYLLLVIGNVLRGEQAEFL